MTAPPPARAIAAEVPSFDRPITTTNGADVLRAAQLPVPHYDPLPTLIEPDLAPVAAPCSEPLVPLAHRRIRLLQNYWHAGWTHARPDVWMRTGAAERLYAVAEGLPARFGLAVFDAWRPLDLQAELFDSAYADPTLPPGFVSEPNSDPLLPTPHLTGGTVDLTLTIDGIPIAPGAGFDDFTTRAGAAALERADAKDREAVANRDLRRMLYWEMRSEGFVVLDCEWWHFEYGTRRWAALTGSPSIYAAATPPGDRR